MVFAALLQASPPYRDHLCLGSMFAKCLFSRSAESVELSLLHVRDPDSTARAHEHANPDQARGKSEQ
jgi:hypothetical protein